MPWILFWAACWPMATFAVHGLTPLLRLTCSFECGFLPSYMLRLGLPSLNAASLPSCIYIALLMVRCDIFVDLYLYSAPHGALSLRSLQTGLATSLSSLNAAPLPS